MGVEDYRELGYYPNHPRALEVFRSFAKKKYGTLKEANRVWHKDFKDWKNVYPPHLDEWDARIRRDYAFAKQRFEAISGDVL
ncbi:MAG: beta-galactosidase [Lentisphaeria bacterium]|nr:MAG: beta-galactosidase [Lentisphaeria bacterium]